MGTAVGTSVPTKGAPPEIVPGLKAAGTHEPPEYVYAKTLVGTVPEPSEDVSESGATRLTDCENPTLMKPTSVAPAGTAGAVKPTGAAVEIDAPTTEPASEVTGAGIPTLPVSPEPVSASWTGNPVSACVEPAPVKFAVKAGVVEDCEHPTTVIAKIMLSAV